MNFKTTIVLIVLLAVVGVAVFFVQREPAAPEQTTEQAAAADEKPLLPDVKQEEISKVTVTPADGGEVMAFEKRSGEWYLTQPVQGKADAFEVGDFIRELAGLKTRTQVGSDVQTGVDQPRYTVELTAGDKTHKLAIGTKSEVGQFQYIKVDDSAQASVVPADLDRFLSRPPREYRDLKLVDAQSSAVNEVTIKRENDPLTLSKQGGDWKITQPKPVPADAQEVQSLISAIVGLRAVEFVDKPQPASAYRFDQPQLVVTYAEQGEPSPATTQSSAASRPTAKRIIFGRYEDVLKRNVFADVNGTIAKVSASALAQLNKTPLDLRDRTVLEVAGDQVQQIDIRRESAATTQPTTRPASTTDVVLLRSKNASTEPTATSQAATAPATAPAEPAARWVFGGSATTRGTVDEARVDELLSSLHPLRATKFVASLPTSRPTDHYTLTLATKDGGKHVVNVFAHPAGDGQAVAEYNGLVFEVAGTLVDRLKADFTGNSAGPGAAPKSSEIP